MKKELKIIIYIMFGIITLLSYPQTTNALNYDTNDITSTATREELQSYIKALAKQYYYKNTYTDYEQGQMDDTNNTVKTTSFMFRDFTIEPEMLNQTNTGLFDCISYVTNVYMNAVGYYFADYYKDSPYYYYYFNNSNKFMKMQLNFNDFTNGVLKTGKGINCTMIENIVKKKGTFNKGTIYKYNQENDLITFYYEATNKENLNKMNEIYTDLEENLQDGDIVIIRRKNGTKETAHALIYFNEIPNSYRIERKGFLHASGTDYNFTNYEKGDDAKAISLIEYNYFNGTYGNEKGYFFNPTSNGYSAFSIVVIRPINEILNKNYINLYDKTSGKIITNNNAIARKELENLNIETNAYVNINNTYKNVSKYQSVNIGETVKYSIKLKNEIYDNYTINVEDIIPENSAYISCANDCQYDSTTRKIKWENIEINEGTDLVLSYNIKVTNGTKMANDGFKITSNNKTLDMGKISFAVNPTFRTEEQTKLINEVNTARSKKSYKYLTITSSITTDNYAKKLSSLNSKNKISMNPTSIIKSLYYNAFNININKINYYRSAIYSTTNDGYIKRSSTYNDIYKINKILVPGLYGGTRVRGNNDNLRTRDFNFNDLEIGDIIIPASSTNAYIFLGKNSENEFRIVDGYLNIYTNTAAINKLRKIYTYTNFAVLRPSKYYMINILFDYNGGTTDESIEKRTMTNGEIYKNLPKPTKEYTVSFNYKDYNNQNLPNNLKVTNKLIAWYDGNTKIIENTSKSLRGPIIELTAKYENNSIILPLPEKEDVIFDGWYDQETGGKKIGNAYDLYIPTKDITLFARWKNDDVGEITIKNTEGGTIQLENTSFKKGSNVVFTVLLENYYSLISVKNIEINKINDTTYSFTMPNYNVSLEPIYTVDVPAPSSIKSTSISYNTIKLTWDKSSLADGYGIYKYNTTSKAYVFINSTTNLNYTTSYNLTTGKRSYYKIRPYKIMNNKKIYGTYSKSISIIPIPSTPTKVNATKYKKGVAKITWNKVTGAQGYALYKYNSNTKKYSYITRTSKNYIITSKYLKSNSKTYYKVRAYRIINKTRIYGNYSVSDYVKV